LRCDPKKRFASAAALEAALDGYVGRMRAEGAPGASVRGFMLEVARLVGRRPAGARARPEEQSPPTIALADVEIVTGTDERARRPEPSPPPFHPQQARAQPEPQAPRPRRRRRNFVAAAVAAALFVLVGGGLASYLRTDGPAHAAADRVQIVLDSSPQGALVTRVVDGESALSLGETPLLLDLPRSPRPLSFQLRKAGYEAANYKLIPNSSAAPVVGLRRAAQAARAAYLGEERTP